MGLMEDLHGVQQSAGVTGHETQRERRQRPLAGGRRHLQGQEVFDTVHNLPGEERRAKKGGQQMIGYVTTGPGVLLTFAWERGLARLGGLVITFGEIPLLLVVRFSSRNI